MALSVNQLTGFGSGGGVFIKGIEYSGSWPLTGSNISVTVPAGAAIGDLLILCIGTPSIGVTTGSWGFPSTTMTGLIAASSTGGGGQDNHSLGIFYRVVTGTEWSAIDVTVVNNGNEASMMLISGITGTPEAQSISYSNASNAPNPPSITPSWGASLSLFLVVATADAPNITVNTWPTGYDLFQTEVEPGAGAGPSFAIAGKIASSSPEDPSAFSFTTGDSVAFTIAVRSA